MTQENEDLQRAREVALWSAREAEVKIPLHRITDILLARQTDCDTNACARTPRAPHACSVMLSRVPSCACRARTHASNSITARARQRALWAV